MNTDQEERAAYQRAVVLAQNEIGDLRRRAEQAEALALTLQQQRDQAEYDNAGLVAILREIDYADPTRAQRLLDQARESEHPGRALMARALNELEAARAAVEAEREACAQIVELECTQRGEDWIGCVIAAAIRARGESA